MKPKLNRPTLLAAAHGSATWNDSSKRKVNSKSRTPTAAVWGYTGRLLSAASGHTATVERSKARSKHWCRNTSGSNAKN